METRLFRVIMYIYRWLFARKQCYVLNKLLLELSLRGLGIRNFEDENVSGEGNFFRKVLADRKNLIVMDVGANQGDFASKLLEYCPGAVVYSFEPHPGTFRLLQARSLQRNFNCFNLGFSDMSGTMQLFDRQDETDGTQHATLYREVIEDIHQSPAQAVDVAISTIDIFVAAQAIPHIHLLKIDTEGNELNVLKGARQTIARNMIDMIQIEFNEMNTVSRVFFKDFFMLLDNYDCYRLLPGGLLPIRKYRPLQCELFAFQNILFVRRDLGIKL